VFQIRSAFGFNANPDPAFQVNANLDPVQGSRAWMTKNWKNLLLKKIIFLKSKIAIYLSLRLHK
jgi:hypothetical protein